LISLTSQKNLSPIKRPESNPVLPYRGRFAPSPSGLLHFGSLISALASFLDTKAHIDANNNQGTWLIRIEDIDPPREQPGASAAILTSLEAFGLHWDEEVLYQSQQTELYRHLLDDLQQNNLSYYCQCSRADVKALGGIYQGHCRSLDKPQSNSAIRLINRFGHYQFNDLIQNETLNKTQCDKALAEEDFIIHRKDGLFAYQLAVVHDDIFQGITHVIRGCDLLEPTARQLSLFSSLNKSPPIYGHVPLAVTSNGYKLSKQNKAPAIDNDQPQPALIAALEFLGQQPPPALLQENVIDIIKWATDNWLRGNVPKLKEINIE